MNADEIDQPLRDEIDPLMGIVEKFAHSDRGAALLAKLAEICVGFGGEWIFNEKRMIPLQLLAQIDGVNGLDPLVNIVQQFHRVAALAPDMLKHGRRGFEIRAG